jgi:hypothetical protein
MAFDTFHPFPKLPLELRIIIWSFACPGPRVVEVTRTVLSFSDPTALFCPREGASKPCGLLRANKESREVFLKQWQPLLPSRFRRGTDYSYQKLLDSHLLKKQVLSPCEFFNPKIDAIYFTNPGFEEDYRHDGRRLPTRIWSSALHKIECLKELRYLACEDRVLCPLRDEEIQAEINEVLSFEKLVGFTVAGGDRISQIKDTRKFRGKITLGRKPKRSTRSISARNGTYMLNRVKAIAGEKLNNRKIDLVYRHVRRNGKLMDP